MWAMTQLKSRGSSATSMGSPADFSAMLRLFAEGTLEPVIDEVVAFGDVPAAAQRVLDGEQFGKVVVRVAD